MEFNLDMSRRILGSVVVPSCSFLIYNRNRPQTLNAKSQFNFEKYQTHPTRIKVKFGEFWCGNHHKKILARNPRA